MNIAGAPRYTNVAPRSYYSAACPTPVAGGEELDHRKMGAEMLMLGLRTADGLSAPAGFQEELDELAASGLIERRDGRVAPTRRGLDLHNQIALAVL
jgi:coproporphyrinogen III oxidase-like Fe-S oxidoreductase